MARLRGSVPIAHTLAERGANRLWDLLQERPYINALGAVTGNQAMQMVRAGLEAIYLSGWQVAADANVAGAMYPDQSLYPANSGPELARRINRTFKRADEIEHAEGGASRDWFAPIVADAEAGFGGPLNAFEIMKAYIEAGAAGVHFEDQLASEKKCGHLGGKVLIPTAAHERNLSAARLAADTMGVPSLIVARTDAESARLITSDVDERDRPFIEPDSRTPEGFYRLKEGTGLDHCIARGLAFASCADLLWWETSHPNLEEARIFAEAVHARHPGKLLAYNCSPSFNWRAKLDASTIAHFQRELGAMGYKFQFVTLAGFHALNLSHVRSRVRLPRPRHGGLFRAAAGGIRRRAARLHGDAPPARGRDRLFRRGLRRHHGRPVLDHRHEGIDGSGSVRAQAEAASGRMNTTVGERVMLNGTMNGTRFWIVGGEYTCCDFDILIRGTEKLLGPYSSREDAERAWRRLSEEHRPQAQVRFTIAQEGAPAIHHA